MSGKVSGYTEKIFTQDEVKDILSESIEDMVGDLGWEEHTNEYQRTRNL
jgi:hypothetical protein